MPWLWVVLVFPVYGAVAGLTAMRFKGIKHVHPSKLNEGCASLASPNFGCNCNAHEWWGALWLPLFLWWLVRHVYFLLFLLPLRLAFDAGVYMNRRTTQSKALLER